MPGKGARLWVPPGFLHGFCTPEDETDIFYKATAYNSPDHDAGGVSAKNSLHRLIL